jgi:uncharacterized membrane-anchored protein YjiN (DUF445 family)
MKYINSFNIYLFESLEESKNFLYQINNIVDSNKKMKIINIDQEYNKSGLLELLKKNKNNFPFLETPIKMIIQLLNIYGSGNLNSQVSELRKKIYSYLENEIPKLIKESPNQNIPNQNIPNQNIPGQKEYSEKYPKMTRQDESDLNKEFDRLLIKYDDNKDLENLHNQYMNCKDKEGNSLKNMDYDNWYDKLKDIFKKK